MGMEGEQQPTASTTSCLASGFSGSTYPIYLDGVRLLVVGLHISDTKQNGGPPGGGFLGFFGARTDDHSS